MATIFAYEKAYKVLNTNIHKSKRKYYKIERIESVDNEDIALDVVEADNVIDGVVEEFDISALSEGVKYWCNRVDDMSMLHQDAEIRRDVLSKRHSEIENKKKDLEHKIELDGRFNASLGYKYAKELQEILIIRREIKDELLIIGVVLGVKIEVDTTRVKKSARGLITRKYTPRASNVLSIA
jgi:hypothetical protein